MQRCDKRISTMDQKKTIRVFPPIRAILLLCFLLFVILGCIFYLISSVKTLIDFPDPNWRALEIGLLFVSAIGLIGGIALLLYSAFWYYMCYCRVVTVSESGVQMGSVFLSWDQISGYGIAKVMPSNTNRAKQMVIYFCSGAWSHYAITKHGVGDMWEMSRSKRGKPVLLGKRDPSFSEDTPIPDQIVWVRYSQELYDFVSARSLQALQKQKSNKK